MVRKDYMKTYNRNAKDIGGKVSDFCWEKFMLLGARLGCHQMPKRSFFVCGYQFPLCARCTGLILGYIIAMAAWRYIHISNICSILVCLPLIVDGLTQYIHLRESNQVLRLITGLMCGVGSAHLEITVVIKIINFLQGRIME